MLYVWCCEQSCGLVSLSGREACLVTEKGDELGSTVVSDLFDGVWPGNERLVFSESNELHVVLSELNL